MRVAAAIFALVVSLVGPAALAAEHPATAIQLSFLLDPRLAGGTYGGERWVSPPNYSGARAQQTVEAMARAIDASGRPTKAGVEWTPSDPELVAVSPPRGERVKITVKRSGESGLVLKSGAVTRKLIVKATQKDGVWHVNISQ